MGRPRAFDPDRALAAALDLFWRKGFEGTSLSDLTGAMGISRPSLYGAFGNKERLFRLVLDRYQATCMSFFEEALRQPTARRMVERLLYGFADAQTDRVHPPGCLGTSGALACSEAADPIRTELIAHRATQEVALRQRLQRAVAEHDLPAATDVADLAGYVMTLVQGMSVQSASGADREMLYGIVRTALRAWPEAAA